jgi:hypothetical protein
VSTDQSAESKRARRLAAREERQRAAEAGRRKAKQRRLLTFALLGILVVALLAGGGYLLSQSLMRPGLGVALADEGRDHVPQGTPLTFRANPPASGTHYDNWTRSGVYTEPQAPGNWVHSLEHGYIVVLYNCPEACPDLVSQLRSVYEAAPKSPRFGYQKMVVTPYANMDTRLAAVAWNRVLTMDTFDRDLLLEFYRTYLEKGPEVAG